MRRKILCAVLSLLMVVSLLPIVVGADETSVLDLAFTQRETAVGATEVRVGVDMSGNPGLVTATIPVKWDNNVLHLKSVTPSTDIIGSGWCGMSMDEYTSNGTYYLAWDNDLATQDYTTDTGCLAELVFTIVDPDVDTSTELKFDLTDERANIMNYSMIDLSETITVTAGAKMVNVTAKEAGGDTPDPEPSDANVVLTLGDITALPGDEILVPVSITSKVAYNTIGIKLADTDGVWLYDETILTFVEFVEDTNMTSAPIMSKFDNEKKIISISFKGANTYTGTVGHIKFKVKESLDDTVTYVSVMPTIKNAQNVLDTDVVRSKVQITNQLLGDIDGNGYVDVDDAILLMQYSIFPEDYPIEYVRNVDFDKNGYVDVDDAILLMQYSIFPEDYPIS